MQSFSSRIWTRIAVSISYDDNDYTTGTSIHHEHLQKNDYDKDCYELGLQQVYIKYLLRPRP